MKLKLNIFIHVKTHEEIHNYAQIVHLYYSDNTFEEKEAKEWLEEIGCDLNMISDNKIVFTFLMIGILLELLYLKVGKFVLRMI